MSTVCLLASKVSDAKLAEDSMYLMSHSSFLAFSVLCVLSQLNYNVSHIDLVEFNLVRVH